MEDVFAALEPGDKEHSTLKALAARRKTAQALPTRARFLRARQAEHGGRGRVGFAQGDGGQMRATLCRAADGLHDGPRSTPCSIAPGLTLPSIDAICRDVRIEEKRPAKLLEQLDVACGTRP